MACFAYIEAFYNPLRLHSGLGYRSPADYERTYQHGAGQPNHEPTRTSPLIVHENGSIPLEWEWIVHALHILSCDTRIMFAILGSTSVTPGLTGVYALTCVSVIIPCFQDTRFLDEAIASVRLSCNLDFEVILIDDGSDPPLEFDRVRAKFDSSDIRVFRQKHLGLSSARNLGLELSRGEYVQFLDADDVLGLDKISKQVASLRLSGADLSLSNFRICNFDISKTWRISHMLSEEAPFSFNSVFRYWGDLIVVPIHSSLMRSSLARKHLFETRVHAIEDWLWWLDILARGVSIDYSPEVEVLYRRHDGNMSSEMGSMRYWTIVALRIALEKNGNLLESDDLHVRIENVITMYYAELETRLGRELLHAMLNSYATFGKLNSQDTQLVR